MEHELLTTNQQRMTTRRIIFDIERFSKEYRKTQIKAIAKAYQK